jgi:pyrroloquinoline quinone (PQQ) biosynthesis protein C
VSSRVAVLGADRQTHHHGHGFTAAWVAAQLADTFLRQYLKALPKLRREAEKAQKAEAKATREREREREKQDRAANERNVANGAEKLRALGYDLSVRPAYALSALQPAEFGEGADRGAHRPRFQRLRERAGHPAPEPAELGHHRVHQ